VRKALALALALLASLAWGQIRRFNELHKQGG